MRQIIAMGHGGFSMNPDNLVLDAYICEQSGKPRPKVCFLPQASGESRDYIINFYTAFTRLNAEPSYLSLFQPQSADLEDYLLTKDVIYVGGGNTKSLLALWREWGLHLILRKALEGGVVLAGLSAGAICWFDAFSTDSVPGKLTALAGLGYLTGSCCPHYNGEVNRRPSYHHLIDSGELPPGVGIDEGAAVHYVDDMPIKVVASMLDVTAYAVTKNNDRVDETEFPATFLPSV